LRVLRKGDTAGRAISQDVADVDFYSFDGGFSAQDLWAGRICRLFLEKDCQREET
jgi:hypothetical protein